MPGRLLALQGRPRDPFAAFIRDYRPDLKVPEDQIVPSDGKSGWTPGDEMAEPACSKCSDGRRIEVGSLLYCPKCHRSGFDRKLAEQRAIAPAPRRIRTSPAKPPKSRSAKPRKSTRP